MRRTIPEPKYRDLAERLTAYEDAAIVEVDFAASFRVVRKLGRALSILTGVAGFRSLLLRALTLAKSEAPPLSCVGVRADGSLEGVDGIGNANGASGVALVAHLLALLVAFLGEGLMLRLVLDVWPEFPVAIWRGEDDDPTRQS